MCVLGGCWGALLSAGSMHPWWPGPRSLAACVCPGPGTAASEGPSQVYVSGVIQAGDGGAEESVGEGDLKLFAEGRLWRAWFPSCDAAVPPFFPPLRAAAGHWRAVAPRMVPHLLW